MTQPKKVDKKKDAAAKKAGKGKDKKVKREKAIKDVIPGGKGGAHAKKKKWSKAKTKEKLANASYFTKELYDKLLTDIPKLKVITTAIVSDRLKVMGSMARKGIQELLRLGKVKISGDHISGQSVYTRSVVAVKEDAPQKKEGKKEAKAKETKEKKHE